MKTTKDEIKQALRAKRPPKVVGAGSEPEATWKDAHEAATEYLGLKRYKVIRHD